MNHQWPEDWQFAEELQPQPERRTNWPFVITWSLVVIGCASLWTAVGRWLFL